MSDIPIPRPHLVVLLWICSSIDISFIMGHPSHQLLEQPHECSVEEVVTDSQPLAALCYGAQDCRPSWADYSIILFPTMCPPYHSSFSVEPLVPQLVLHLGFVPS